ncbi:MAG: hypothetical protein JXN61_09210 [Sedimentisphaerales bacterium]|nr:hypothetical protein [Sedimentisphaerales bacterium]
MNRFRCMVVALGIVVLGGGKAVRADNGTDFELAADFFSKYIWRGQNLDDDPVFQPSISISHKNVTASVWGNLEFTNINGNSGDFSELDYSLDYSGAVPGVEGLGYSIGLIYYDFPGTLVKDTTEAYLGFSFDLALNPSLTIYHDIDEAEGSYVSLAFSHSIEKIAELGVDTPVGMELGASLGWGSGSYNKYYWGTDQSKLNDLTFSASFPFDVAGWTVVPSLNYVTLLSDDIRATDTYDTAGDYFYAGIGFVKEF